MRDFLFVCCSSFLSMLLATGFARVALVPDDPLPVALTPRTLAADPERYVGHRVAFSVGGFQPGEQRNQLVYRTRADLPPIVVCTFSVPLDGTLPKRFVGRVGERANAGDAVPVGECVTFSP